jgi:hypothetical protein
MIEYIGETSSPVRLTSPGITQLISSLVNFDWDKYMRPLAPIFALPSRPNLADRRAKDVAGQATVAKLNVAPTTTAHVNAEATAALERTKDGERPYPMKDELYTIEHATRHA